MVWNGRVFFTTWGGDIVAVHEHTGALLWQINICTEIYDLTPVACAAFNANKRYISVATPALWGDRLVVSVRKPADVIVITQDKGELVRKRNLDANQYAEITMSGTVWNNDLYVGTAISDVDSFFDANSCTFTGKFFRIDLHDHELDPVWTWDPSDAHGDSVGPTGYTGLRFKGSSPPLSLRSGLIYVTVGPLICSPLPFIECVGSVTCGVEFDYNAYEAAYDNCYNNEVLGSDNVFFNSVVSLRTDTGEVYWHEKLIGERAWELACLGYNSTDPCGERFEEDCDFYHNRYLNCPTEPNSCEDDFDFADDPVYKLHSEGRQDVFVMQNNGNIYRFDALRNENENRAFEAAERAGRARSRQLLWAIDVRAHGKGGGLAVDMDTVYFSIYNNGFNPQPWIYANNVSALPVGDPDDDDVDDTFTFLYTPCGGWGALQVHNRGLPRWYKPNPRCNLTYDFGACLSDDTPLDPIFSGGRSAPSVTNDLVVVTSQDTSRTFNTPPWTTGPQYCGGNIFALDTKTGDVVTRTWTGEPFGKQGAAIHGRCVYAGNGPNPYFLPAAGHSFYGWCVPQAYPLSGDHTTDNGPFN
jgi:outer membrane protein assembly factor BamB